MKVSAVLAGLVLLSVLAPSVLGYTRHLVLDSSTTANFTLVIADSEVSRNTIGSSSTTWVSSWLFVPTGSVGGTLFAFGSTSAGWAVTVNNAGAIGYRCGSSTTFAAIGTAAVALDTWTHVTVAGNVSGSTITFKVATTTGGSVTRTSFTTPALSCTPQLPLKADMSVGKLVGDAAFPGPNVKLGGWFIGHTHVPNDYEIGLMMVGTVNYDNPGLVYYNPMISPNFVQLLRVRDGLFDSIPDVTDYDRQASSIDIPSGVTIVSWSCNGSAKEAWEQCDSTIYCSSCQCVESALPSTGAECSLARTIQSSASWLLPTSTNSIVPTPTPVFSARNGLTIAMWASVTGHTSSVVLFSISSSPATNDGMAFGVLPSTDSNGPNSFAFLNRDGSFKQFPYAGTQSRPDITIGGRPNLQHIALVLDGNSANTGCPGLKIYVNATMVLQANPGAAPCAVENNVLNSLMELAWAPVSSGTVKLLRPQLWAVNLTQSEIQLASRGVSPPSAQFASRIFLATDEGAGTTTLNLATNVPQTLNGGATWAVGNCGGSADPWEQCDTATAGGVGCTNKCVCSDGYAASSSGTCSLLPIVQQNTANVATNFPNALKINVTYQSPLDFSVTLTPVGYNKDPKCYLVGDLFVPLGGDIYMITCKPVDTTVLVEGPLYAIVTSNQAQSNVTQIATVVRQPNVVRTDTVNYAANATSVTISGSSFGTIRSEVSVTLTVDPTGSPKYPTCDVTSVTDIAIICSPTFSSVVPAGATWPLLASVTRAGGLDVDASVNNPEQIGVLIESPTLNKATTKQGVSQRNLKLTGTFPISYTGYTMSDYQVTLSQVGAVDQSCTITGLSATVLNCTAAGNFIVGDLFAKVGFLNGGPPTTQVATIGAAPHIDSASSPSIIVQKLANFTVCGSNFDPVYASNTLIIFLTRNVTTKPDGKDGNCLIFNVIAPVAGTVSLVVETYAGQSNNFTLGNAVIAPALYSRFEIDTLKIRGGYPQVVGVDYFTAVDANTTLVGTNFQPSMNIDAYLYDGNFTQDTIANINFTAVFYNNPSKVNAISCSPYFVNENKTVCTFPLTNADIGKTIIGRIVAAAYPDAPFEYITQVIGKPVVTPQSNRFLVETSRRVQIFGNNFNPTNSMNKITFRIGGIEVASCGPNEFQGMPTGSTSDLSCMLPMNALRGHTGVMTAEVTASGTTSDAAIVYTVLPAPTISNTTAERITLSEVAGTLMIHGSGFVEPPYHAENFVYFDNPSDGAGYTVQDTSNSTHLFLSSLTQLKPGRLAVAVIIYGGANVKKRAAPPTEWINELTYYELGTIVPAAAITTRNLALAHGTQEFTVICTNCDPVASGNVLEIEGATGVTIISVTGTRASAELRVSATLVPGTLNVRISAFGGGDSAYTAIGTVFGAPQFVLVDAPIDLSAAPEAAKAPSNLSPSETSGNQSGSNTAGIAIGIVIVVLIVIGAIIAVVIILKRRQKSGAALARASIPPRMTQEGNATDVWDQELEEGGGDDE